MTDPEARLERLGPEHALEGFESGQADLDAWLSRHALAAQQMDSARTFVLVQAGRVIGYFSLTMGSVRRAEAPAKLVRGLPSYPVGMVLLARLAVDQEFQGRGLGPRSWLRRSERQSSPARPPPLAWSWSTPSTNKRPVSTPVTGSSPPLSRARGSTAE